MQKETYIRKGLYIERAMYMYMSKDLYIKRDMYSQKRPIYVERDSSLPFVAMGWLRMVGSLKLHVSFAEYRLFDRALLQKRPMLLGSLLIAATPYQVGKQKETYLPKETHFPKDAHLLVECVCAKRDLYM